MNSAEGRTPDANFNSHYKNAPTKLCNGCTHQRLWQDEGTESWHREHGGAHAQACRGVALAGIPAEGQRYGVRGAGGVKCRRIKCRGRRMESKLQGAGGWKGTGTTCKGGQCHRLASAKAVHEKCR